MRLYLPVEDLRRDVGVVGCGLPPPHCAVLGVHADEGHCSRCVRCDGVDLHGRSSAAEGEFSNRYRSCSARMSSLGALSEASAAFRRTSSADRMPTTAQAISGVERTKSMRSEE